MKLGGEEKGNKMNEGGKKGVKGIREGLWEKDVQLKIVTLRKLVEKWAFIGYYHANLLPGSLLTFHEFVYSLASSETQTSHFWSTVECLVTLL